jgi:hypothetical protein
VSDDGCGVLVVDMATVLPKMDRDLVGPRPLADSHSLERIGIVDAACLPEHRDMVDIDTQFHRFPFFKLFSIDVKDCRK